MVLNILELYLIYIHEIRISSHFISFSVVVFDVLDHLFDMFPHLQSWW